MSGCTYVIGRTSRWNACLRQNESVPYFCRKIPSANSELCPLHELIAEDEARELERQKKRRADKKAAHQREMDELATSPLAAINPKFATTKDTGYEQ